MTFRQYDTLVKSCAQYPDINQNLIYPALGLAGESGEYVDKIKKLWRNEDVTGLDELNRLSSGTEKRQELLKELGDILWYINASASSLGSSLEEVAAINAAKLLDRKDRNVIKSEGDNR